MSPDRREPVVQPQISIFYRSYMNEATLDQVASHLPPTDILAKAQGFLQTVNTPDLAGLTASLINELSRDRRGLRDTNRRDAAAAYLRVAPLDRIPAEDLTTMYTASINQLEADADPLGAPYSLVEAGTTFAPFLRNDPDAIAAIVTAWAKVDQRLNTHGNWDTIQVSLRTMLDSYKSGEVGNGEPQEGKEVVIFQYRGKERTATEELTDTQKLIQDIKELWANGKKQTEIAKELQKSKARVSYYISLLILADEITDERKHKVGDTERLDERRFMIRYLAHLDKSPEEIAQITGLASDKVFAHLYRLGIISSIPKTPNPDAKVSEKVQNRRAALVPFAGKMTQAALAAQFGVSVSIINADLRALVREEKIPPEVLKVFAKTGAQAERIIAAARQDPTKSQGVIARELGTSQGFVSNVLRQAKAKGEL